MPQNAESQPSTNPLMNSDETSQLPRRAQPAPKRQELQKFFAIDDLQWDANCTGAQVRSALTRAFLAHASDQTFISELKGELADSVSNTKDAWARAAALKVQNAMLVSTLDALVKADMELDPTDEDRVEVKQALAAINSVTKS